MSFLDRFRKSPASPNTSPSPERQAVWGGAEDFGRDLNELRVLRSQTSNVMWSDASEHRIEVVTQADDAPEAQLVTDSDAGDTLRRPITGDGVLADATTPYHVRKAVNGLNAELAELRQKVEQDRPALNEGGHDQTPEASGPAATPDHTL